MEWLKTIGAGAFQVKWFLILYIATILPCWITLFLAVKAIIGRKVSFFILWSLSLVLLLALPYVFVLITLHNIPLQLWVATPVILAFIYYKTFLSKKSLSVEWFWDWYAKRYDTLLFFYPYTKLINDVADEVIKNLNHGINVLEIGCGSGNLAYSLRNETIQYVGVDTSKVMLAKATEKLRNYRNFSFVHEDLSEDLSTINETFDIVVVNNVLYAIEDHVIVIDKIKKILNPNGLIVISEPARNSSIKSIFVEFIKKGGFTAVFQIIIHFGSFIFIVIANLMITEIEHIKRKNYFDEDELTKELFEHGFNVLDTKRVYANQNLMIVAKSN